MVGADLRNLVNEAALTAARRGHARVQAADFTDALEKVVLGTARRIVLSPVERRRTAVHEAGHALLGMLQPGADPVRKVSIIPRGRALGVTLQTPASDRYGYTSVELRGRITGLLGGRAAEQLLYDDTTTGAEADLEQATALARHMVARWGMSEALGPLSVDADVTTLAPGGNPASDRTRDLVDHEVRSLLEECADQALRLLGEHRDQLGALVDALMERETLDQADAYRAAGIEPADDHVADSTAPARATVTGPPAPAQESSTMPHQ